MPTCPSCRKHYPDGTTTCDVDGEGLLPDEAFSAADVELPAGYVIGEYRVEAKIGEGGFGCVYRAVHPLIGKAAAIKVLNRQYSSNPQMVSRFIAEARAVNQIKNRNIIDIFSFGALDDGRQYYVMELLEGAPLDRYVRDRGRLTPEEAVPILRGIAKALDAAHAAGIAHRDLKPENVFLAIDDEGVAYPKLLDFGIAKLLGDSMTTHKTRTGTPMGTPHYMSPEQCRGKNVDHRTDIYSFGILVFETLTGKLPFDGDDVMDVLFKQTSAPAPRMSSVCPEVPASLDGPVLQMLEKDPANRPASMVAAVDELAAAAREAGFEVASNPRAMSPRALASGASSTKSSPSGKGLTPAEVGAIGSAQTLVQPVTGKTLMASESEVRAPPRSRTLLYALAGIALAGGISVGVFVTRSSKTTVATVDAPSHEPVVSAPTTPRAETATPTVAPGSTAPTPSAQPATDVEITIESNAPKADVFQGKTKIGTAPGALKLTRGDEPIKLTFKAPGYKPLDLDVTPSKDDKLRAELVKIPAGAGAKHGNKDLEF